MKGRLFKLRRIYQAISDQYRIRQIIILLSMRCNLSCKHCGVRFYNGRWPECRELNYEEWLSIFEEIESTSEIVLNGGEPTLHKDFNLIVEFLSKKHLVYVYTNLLSMNLGLIKSNKNISLVVSLHPGMSQLQNIIWNQNYNILIKRFPINVKHLGFNTKILEVGEETYKQCFLMPGPWMTPDGNFFLNQGEAYKYMFNKYDEQNPIQEEILSAGEN